MIKPIVLSMGEPAGIGAEITAKAWLETRHELVPFALIDCPERIRKIVSSLGWNVPIKEIFSLSEVPPLFQNALPVLKQSIHDAELGELSALNAKSVIQSIEKAVSLVHSNEASALVTNPIHKSVLIESGFKFPGHTEFLAHLAGIKHPPVMMLASDELRVVPLTIHMPMRDTLNVLSEELIIEKCQIIEADLKNQFGIPKPHLAIAGLNPHAGESGQMGREEIDIIEPAIKKMKSMGLNVTGPYPPDTMFHKKARQSYDVAVCMYHDQALIPIKTINFDEGVNVTLGLPFIRTSPDHGTALDIAGKGIADPTSLICAIKMAEQMALHRQKS